MTPFVFYSRGTWCLTLRLYLGSHTVPSCSAVAWITARTVLTGLLLLLLPGFVLFSAQPKEIPFQPVSSRPSAQHLLLP